MKMTQEQNTNTDQPRTIRDSKDGQLKTTIPIQDETKPVEEKKAEVADGEIK